MRKPRILTFFLLITIFIQVSCEAEQQPVHINKRKRLKHIPDASGILISGKEYLVIGDRSPYLYTLNDHFVVVKKTPLTDVSEAEDDKLPGKHKPDFECMAIWNDSLFVLGSGSKKGSRDIMALWDRKAEIILQVDLHKFYSKLRNLSPDNRINIEGITISNKVVNLFDRRSNCIFTFERKALFDCWLNDSSFPSPEINRYLLPEISGVPSGFSGGTISPDGQFIYFTSSVEREGSSDEKILGSFIGRIPLENGLPFSSINFVHQFPETHGVLKIESIVVSAKHETTTDLILVSDSDGNGSHAIKCRVYH